MKYSPYLDRTRLWVRSPIGWELPLFLFIPAHALFQKVGNKDSSNTKYHIGTVPRRYKHPVQFAEHLCSVILPDSDSDLIHMFWKWPSTIVLKLCDLATHLFKSPSIQSHTPLPFKLTCQPMANCLSYGLLVKHAEEASRLALTLSNS